MISRKWLLPVVLMVTLAMLLSACGQKPATPPAPEKPADVAEEKKPSGIVRVGSIGDAQNLIPILVTDSASQDIVYWLFSYLLRTDSRTLEPTPEIAEKWDISSDNLVYTFYLNKNAKWSDGKPITAKDVAFTIEAVCHPESPSDWFSDFSRIKGARAFKDGKADKIEGIKIIDDHTIEITLEEVYAPFILSMAFAPMPAHVYEGASIKDLKTHPQNSKPTVTSGPFVLEEWARDQYIMVKANPNFWGEGPGLERIIYRIIPDQTAEVIELRTGGLDLIPTAVKIEEVPELQKSPLLEVVTNKRLVYDYIGFNMKKEGPLKDKRVRQALTMVFDPTPLVRDVLKGYGVVVNGPLPPLSWAFDPDLKRLQGTVEEAKALLAQAGYPNGFKMTLYTNEGNEVRENAGLLFKEAVAKLGVEVEFQPMEWGAFLQVLMAPEPTYDAMVLGVGTGVDPDLEYSWHSKSAGNRYGYSNPEVDALIEEGLRVTDLAKRKEIYQKAQRILVDDAPFIFLYVREALHAKNKNFQGFDPHPSTPMYRVDRWYRVD